MAKQAYSFPPGMCRLLSKVPSLTVLGKAFGFCYIRFGNYKFEKCEIKIRRVYSFQSEELSRTKELVQGEWRGGPVLGHVKVRWQLERMPSKRGWKQVTSQWRANATGGRWWREWMESIWMVPMQNLTLVWWKAYVRPRRGVRVTMREYHALVCYRTA